MTEDFQKAKERMRRAAELGLEPVLDIKQPEEEEKVEDSIVEDPDAEELKGYTLDDQSDRWGTRKFRIYFNGIDDITWRRIKTYIRGYGNGFYSPSELRDCDGKGYFWVTCSCWGCKPCPSGEYKFWLDDVEGLVADLKSLFPTIERRGRVLVNRWGEDKKKESK
jgi:hypothetical protein